MKSRETERETQTEPCKGGAPEAGSFGGAYLRHLVHGHGDAVDCEGGQLGAKLGGRGGVLRQRVLQVLQDHALILPHLQGAANQVRERAGPGHEGGAGQ